MCRSDGNGTELDERRLDWRRAGEVKCNYGFTGTQRTTIRRVPCCQFRRCYVEGCGGLDDRQVSGMTGRTTMAVIRAVGVDLLGDGGRSL